jgi:hypothetical protein
MSTAYNAGYINVQGNAYFDPSGSNTAQVNAVNVTVNGTLTTNNLNVPQLNTTNNFTVGGNFDLNGLNLYEGKYEPGDVISYIKKGTMPAATTNAVWTAKIAYTGISAGVRPIVAPNATSDIDFYELVYWGADSRSGDVVRMSATLLVPTTLVSTTIVSYKHGTILNPYQYSTLWSVMQNLLVPDEIGNISEGFSSAWALATEGYVVISADNPAYGISVGSYNFLDPFGEVFSQYNALVAATQLTQKAPTLFPLSFDPAQFDVINGGYSLGALFSPLVSQMIKVNQSTTNINLVNTVAGAPVNAYSLLNWGIYNNTFDTFDVSGNSTVAVSNIPTSVAMYMFTMLYVNGNIFSMPDDLGFKSAITTGVLPMFNQVYLNTNNNVNPPGGFGFTGRVITKTNTVVPGAITYPFGPYVPLLNPPKIWVANDGLLGLTKQCSFYTNIFTDFTDLSGTPINVLYTMQDELACYDYTYPAHGGNPYLGYGPTTDQVAGPLNAFITTTAPGGNGLNRPSGDYSVPGISTLTDSSNTSVYIYANAARLLASESTGLCSNYRANTTGINLSTGAHDPYDSTIFQTVFRTYLRSRI